MKKIREWLANGRVGALVQSVMPAVLAVAMAVGQPGFNVLMALLAVVGVECAHLAMNLADDWFDFRVDMMGDRDRVIRKGFRAMTAKYEYLSSGKQNLKTTAQAIAQFCTVAVVCGCIIFSYRWKVGGFSGADGAWWIVAIVAAAGFLGAFYSAPPLKLAYRGLGELVTGVIFGPLLMMGVYYASCGRIDPGIVWVSIPVGLLVLNILFTHSFIDMPGDAESNKMTFARLLGSMPFARQLGSQKVCLAASYLFNLLPFAMTVGAVCLGYLHPVYLISLVVLPRALWLCRSLTDFTRGKIDVPEKPAPWLGAMTKDWEAVRKAGIDWFLMRWFTARNLLSGFCLALLAARLLALVL